MERGAGLRRSARRLAFATVRDDHGHGLLASSLYRTGYASPRLTVLLPLFAIAATVAYAIAVSAFDSHLRSEQATLNLTVVAFIVGVPAYTAMTILPIAARRERLAPILAERWHLVVIAYAEAAMVLIGFVLLSVLGLA